MIKMLLTAVALAAVGPSATAPDVSAAKPVELARRATCFKTGENTPPGSMYKQCYYDCLGSPVVITVKSYEICPVTIQQ